MWARITRTAVAVAIVVGVASCENGVFDHPGGDTTTDRPTSGRSTGSGSGGHTTVSRNGGDRYGWFLPEGPDSPSVPEDDVYRWLVSRACALLHQAAVHLCRAVRGVLEQRASESVECAGGRPPAWPPGAARDDPRTHADPTTRTTTTTTTTS